MHENVESRLKALARRAGWAGAPPVVVAAGLALACVAVVVALWRWWPRADAGLESASQGADVASAVAPRPPAGAGDNANAGATPGGAATATVRVHVVGAVRRAGVYALAAGTRVGEAVDAAGGARDDAATEAINLAAKIEDGQQVVVPTREQFAAGAVPPAAGAAASGPGGGSGGVAAKVDLNTADAAQFDTLPGVGPSTAAKIVADREANGRFKSVDDLGRVPGIGPKRLETLKDLVVVR